MIDAGTVDEAIKAQVVSGNCAEPDIQPARSYPRRLTCPIPTQVLDIEQKLTERVLWGELQRAARF